MSKGNDLDSIMRRVQTTRGTSNAPRDVDEVRDGGVPGSVSRFLPGSSTCVVEEIHDENIGAACAVVCDSTPEIKERELTREGIAGDETGGGGAAHEKGHDKGECVEYSDGSVYVGEVVMLDGKVVRHGQVGGASSSRDHVLVCVRRSGL